MSIDSSKKKDYSFMLNAPQREVAVLNPLPSTVVIPKGILFGKGFSVALEEDEEVSFEGITLTESGSSTELTLATDVDLEYNRYLEYLDGLLISADVALHPTINRIKSVITGELVIGGLTYEKGNVQIAGANGGILRIINAWR
jgi:hypothetical protein